MSAPAKLWIVVRSNGEHYLLEKEPLEGLAAWAVGQDVIIREYVFLRLVPTRGEPGAHKG